MLHKVLILFELVYLQLKHNTFFSGFFFYVIISSPFYSALIYLLFRMDSFHLLCILIKVVFLVTVEIFYLKRTILILFQIDTFSFKV